MGFRKFLKGFLWDHEYVSWICERAWLYMAHMVQNIFLTVWNTENKDWSTMCRHDQRVHRPNRLLISLISTLSQQRGTNHLKPSWVTVALCREPQGEAQHKCMKMLLDKCCWCMWHIFWLILHCAGADSVSSNMKVSLSVMSSCSQMRSCWWELLMTPTVSSVIIYSICQMMEAFIQSASQYFNCIHILERVAQREPNP